MSSGAEFDSLDALLPELRRHEPDAWTKAFGRLYTVAVHGAKRTQTHISPEDIEEIASEAVAEAARQIGSLENAGQLTAFTFVVARRGAIDRLRRLHARKRRGPTSELETIEELAQVDGGAISVRSTAKWAEISAIIEKLLRDLGEPAATLVRGYTVDGLSYAELAERNQMPLGTVAALIYRGMRRLERKLGRSSRLAQELALYLRLIL